MTTYAPNQLHSVPLTELQPDPMQPRKYVDPLALEEWTALKNTLEEVIAGATNPSQNLV